jgi:predicted nucleic acid-binding protein
LWAAPKVGRSATKKAVRLAQRKVESSESMSVALMVVQRAELMAGQMVEPSAALKGVQMADLMVAQRAIRKEMTLVAVKVALMVVKMVY